MKLIGLDGKKIILDHNKTDEERKEIVTEILNDYNNIIIEYWENNKTKVFLDILSDYLYPIQREDKNILSRKRVKQMNVENKNYVNFTNLSVEDQEALGIKDVGDEEY